MREHGIDLWLLVAREYFEEPVVASMLDAQNMHARRRTILIFYDPGQGKPVERLTVSRYGLGGHFAPAWDPAKQPDQWQAVAEIIAARNPAKIAINTSDLHQFADGMTLSQYQKFMAALLAGNTHTVRNGALPKYCAHRPCRDCRGVFPQGHYPGRHDGRASAMVVS
jgi:hypothetical protein